MNASGRSVRSVLLKNNIEVEDILIIYDDADLEFGDVRLKSGGGSAGHKGMESILKQFPNGTQIARVRVGIGRGEHPDIPLEDFVLQKWTDEEKERLPKIISKAVEVILSQLVGVDPENS